MNDGNNQDFNVSGGLGLISSRLSIQGPLKKDKSSFIISGRRTYADLFLKLSDDDVLKNSKLYFYDLNAKVNYTLNNKNRVFLSGYFGQDQMAVGIYSGSIGEIKRLLFAGTIFLMTSCFQTHRLFIVISYQVEENNGGNRLFTTSKIQDYSNPISNIDGGALGYFSAHTTSRKSVIVQ
jgi:hypothetical protein